MTVNARAKGGTGGRGAPKDDGGEKNRGVTIAECWEAYRDLTGKASDIGRQLAFAGLGVVWLFHTQAGDYPAIPFEMYWPVLFIVLALSLDLAQYLLHSACLGIYSKWKESKHKPAHDEYFCIPEFLLTAPLVLFWLKQAAVATAYVLLFRKLPMLFD